MKRIAVLLPNLYTIGAQRVAIDYGKKFISAGYEVQWLVGELIGTKFEEEIVSDISFFSSKFFVKIRFLRVFERLFNLLCILRREQFDVVYSVTPFLNRIICFFKFLGLIKARVVIEDHAYPPSSYIEEFKGFFIRKFYLKTEFLYKFSSSFRVLSLDAMKYYNSRLKFSHAVFMPNLMDLARINTLAKRTSQFSRKNTPRIVYIGRFCQQKNIIFIIEALSILARKVDFEFILIGSGDEELNILNKINSLNLQDKFKLVQSTDNNYSILKTADIFPMASVWEGMPLVMIEAMFLGVPVVSTTFKTGPDFLLGKNSERGLLVEDGSASSFASALEFALANQKLMSAKALLAKEFIEEHINIDSNFDEYLNLFVLGNVQEQACPD